jgi:hypothetical protein
MQRVVRQRAGHEFEDETKKRARCRVQGKCFRPQNQLLLVKNLRHERVWPSDIISTCPPLGAVRFMRKPRSHPRSWLTMIDGSRLLTIVTACWERFPVHRQARLVGQEQS